MLIFQRWEKDPGIPHQGWLTSGTPPCDWARATSKTSIWPEQMRELCPREAYDESSSTAGQKKTFEQLSKHHRNQKSTTWTSFQQLSLLFLHLQHQKCVKMSPRRSQRKTKRCKRSHQTQRLRLELRTQTEVRSAQKHRRPLREETVDNEVINREANGHVCQRACRTKTGKGNRHEVRRGAHASGDRRFVSVVNTVNTLLSDESGVETNPWNGDSGQTNKFLTILGDPNREMGVVTTVKRSSATANEWYRHDGSMRGRRSREVQISSEGFQS